MDKNIRNIRKERRLTTVRLADLVEPATSNVTITRLETGQVPLTDEWMGKLSKVLECEPWELLPIEWHPKAKIIDDQKRFMEIFNMVDETLDELRRGRYTAKTKAEVSVKLYNSDAGYGKTGGVPLNGDEFKRTLKLVVNG